MKKTFSSPLLIVSTVVLTACLIIVALVATARSAGATLARTQAHAPSSVAQIALPNSTAAYNGVMTPSTTLYAPWMLGSTSVLRVYNAGAVSATVRATFVYSPEIAIQTVIRPGAVGDIQTTLIETATQFSAIVTATQPIVAIVNDFGPDGIYATSYAAMPAELGRTRLVLPSVQYGGDAENSEIAVQNVGALTTAVTILYTQTNKTTPTQWSDSLASLPPGETHIFRASDVVTDTTSENMATIHSDHPVVAVVNTAKPPEIGALHPERSYVYRASLPGAGMDQDSPLYFPFLAREFAGWKESMIRITNASSSGVTFSLHVSEGESQKTIDAWAAQLYLLSTEAPSLSEDAVAGYITDTLPLESLVWLYGKGNFVNDFLAAYSAPGTGANFSYLPYTDQSSTFVTYVAVQNLADDTAAITLTHHTISGTVSTYPDTIGGNEMRYYLGGSGIPSNFTGGVVVQSDRPVAAVAVVAGQLILDETNYLPIVFK